ncbi:MAG: hypothetical protein K6E37_03650 [Bacteroidales bacterium]|nr:hypothetical protein [Bacteroidales bacterium]
MKTLYDSYSAFCLLLEEPANLSLSYEELCSRVRVSPVDLREILLAELGCTGPELLASLRSPAQA